MKYQRYKLSFPYGAHFGDGTLNESEDRFHADTLFSALFIEASNMGMDRWLLEKVKNGKILLSDAFPYSGEHYYLPKPVIHTENQEKTGDSGTKKAFKKLRYITDNNMDKFLKGTLNPFEEAEKARFCNISTKTSVAINGLESTLPYYVGITGFYDGCGLYLIVGCNSDEDAEKLHSLIVSLSYSGIGGKRSAGYGRFLVDSVTEYDSKIFERDSDLYMAMSICLPTDTELERAMEDAFYLLKKRSGFIYSESYASEFHKKKDLYVFSAGSCFTHRFSGDVYDVSNGGKHPVFHYAKAFLLPL